MEVSTQHQSGKEIAIHDRETLRRTLGDLQSKKPPHTTPLNTTGAKGEQ